MIRGSDLDNFKKENSYLSEFSKIGKTFVENGYLIGRGLMS